MAAEISAVIYNSAVDAKSQIHVLPFAEIFTAENLLIFDPWRHMYCVCVHLLYFISFHVGSAHDCQWLDVLPFL